jgi:hypothetical protein
MRSRLQGFSREWAVTVSNRRPPACKESAEVIDRDRIMLCAMDPDFSSSETTT